MKSMFLQTPLTETEYEARVIDLLKVYGVPVDEYNEINTFRYSKWSVAIEDIGQLITFQDYLKIIERPRYDRKFFFYDSDFYVFYSVWHRTNQWELGIGKDPSRSTNFNPLSE